MNHKQLVAGCYEEWRKMHHNASLRGYLPDFASEYEKWIFWEWMADRTRDLCEHLSMDIENKYGWKLTFYQYGRGYATIAPSEWMAAGSDFGGFASWKVLEGVGSGLEGYNRDKQVLAILQWINHYWKAEVECTEEWWDNMKAGDVHFRDLIDEHEGMTLKSVEMWVPAE